MALADNKAKIQDLLAGINALPQAGSGGGLPEGISALASGTFTPTSNLYVFQVTHNLSTVPNFGVCVIEEDVYNTPLTSTAVGCASYMKDATTTPEMVVAFSGYDANDLYRTYASRAMPDSSTVSGTKYTFINDSFLFRSGHTYRWVCGVMDGIQ